MNSNNTTFTDNNLQYNLIIMHKLSFVYLFLTASVSILGFCINLLVIVIYKTRRRTVFSQRHLINAINMSRSAIQRHSTVLPPANHSFTNASEMKTKCSNRRQTLSTYFILSLSVCDLFICMVNIPLELLVNTEMITSLIDNDLFVCKFSNTFYQLLIIFELQIMLMIAINRYKSVFNPMKLYFLSKKRFVHIMVVQFLFACLFSAPNSLIVTTTIGCSPSSSSYSSTLSNRHLKPNPFRCLFKYILPFSNEPNTTDTCLHSSYHIGKLCTIDNKYNNLYMLHRLVLFLLFIVHVSVVSICYVKIYKHVYKESRCCQDEAKKRISIERVKRENNAMSRLKNADLDERKERATRSSNKKVNHELTSGLDADENQKNTRLLYDCEVIKKKICLRRHVKKPLNHGKTACLLIMSTFFFVFTWLPFWYFTWFKKPTTNLDIMFKNTFYLNYILNPIFYSFFNRDFYSDAFGLLMTIKSCCGLSRKYDVKSFRIYSNDDLRFRNKF